MPEPWRQERISGGVRLWIGDPDRLIAHGEHLYVIRYRTTRQIGFFDRYDELYWNATGNGWRFPIDVAEARIRLPEPVPFGQRAVYTGPEGARAADARVVSEQPGDIMFRTTIPLPAANGLTVAVAWPKGVVARPSEAESRRWWLADMVPPAIAAASLLGLLAFFFHAWRKAGRGPRAGTVVPAFTPPEGMSASAVRYVSEMGFDDRAFAAAIVEAGVKGRLRIEEEKKGILSGTERRLIEVSREADLPAPETAMAARLFSSVTTLPMDDKFHETFSEAKEALQEGLKKRFEETHILRNLSWSVAGMMLVGVAVVLTAGAILAAELGTADVALLPAMVALAGFAFAGYCFLAARDLKTTWRLLLLALGALLAVIAAIAGFAAIAGAIESGRALLLVIPALALPVALSAFWWMAAPTKNGRALMDRIAGFRQYLSITEEDRLEAMHPPEKTPALFERYLPFAIALEVENRWADKFRSVLAAAASAGQAQTMGWYSGGRDPWSDPGGFARDVGSTLSSSIASASTAPGSSGGSGGGGSSGGGGGGGGGGGW